MTDSIDTNDPSEVANGHEQQQLQHHQQQADTGATGAGAGNNNSEPSAHPQSYNAAGSANTEPDAGNMEQSLDPAEASTSSCDEACNTGTNGAPHSDKNELNKGKQRVVKELPA